MDKSVKIIFFGTPDFVIPVLEKLIENFTVVGAVTPPDKKVGGKQILISSPIKKFFEKYLKDHNLGGKILTPDKLDEQFIKSLKELDPDLIVVASYGKIIPQVVLDIPRFGSLNIHPSLLPKYRGASPIQTAILNGDTISGVTIIKMDAKMDHGPIVGSRKINLNSQDTFASLTASMFLEGANLLLKVLPDYLAGKISLQSQNDEEATFTKLIKKTDGQIEINNPPNPQTLDRIIRAFYPWPGVWAYWQGKIIKFYPNKFIQLEGKKVVPLADFLRGHPDFPIKDF